MEKVTCRDCKWEGDFLSLRLFPGDSTHSCPECYGSNLSHLPTQGREIMGEAGTINIAAKGFIIKDTGDMAKKFTSVVVDSLIKENEPLKINQKWDDNWIWMRENIEFDANAQWKTIPEKRSPMEITKEDVERIRKRNAEMADLWGKLNSGESPGFKTELMLLIEKYRSTECPDDMQDVLYDAWANGRLYRL